MISQTHFTGQILLLAQDLFVSIELLVQRHKELLNNLLVGYTPEEPV